MRQCQCKIKYMVLNFSQHGGFMEIITTFYVVASSCFPHMVLGVFAQAYSIQIFIVFALGFLKIVFIL
jgi:hypothetical protein